MMDIVEVVWLDAVADSTWTDIEAVKNHGVVEVSTVGYLLKKDERQVTLLMTKGDECVQGYFVIPAGCITEIKQLKPS